MPILKPYPLVPLGLLAIGLCLGPGGSCPVHGQALLYQEHFPHSGSDGPVSNVGWANDIPTNPERLFEQNGAGDGAVYAWQDTPELPISTAFYTTTLLDTGSTGMAFPAIDPSVYPGLTLSIDIRPFLDPDHVESRFAVQMNGTDWYVAAAALPVPTGARELDFTTYRQPFDPGAAAWQVLTLLGSEATIGGPATADLSGQLTGAGLVVSHSVDSGTHDFDNFSLTGDVGVLGIDAVAGSQVDLSWTPFTNVRLQASHDLPVPVWTDVSSTLGQAAATVAMSGAAGFFRLSTLDGATPVPDNAIVNPGFDYDGAPVANPLGWTASGDTGASSVVADGAESTAFSLQHANAADFQVATSQLVDGLTNGTYRLTAKVKSSGGQRACYLAGNGKRTSLAALDAEWTDLVVRGIEVTNGQCLVEIVSDGVSGTWCRVDSLALTRDDIPYTFLKGGDVSELPRLEYYGGQYFDGGVAGDCLQIMRDHGCNLGRVRLYNDPGNTNFYPSSELDPLGWQNPSNSLALCRRVKDAGMQILFTFHYSDYWSNPGQQYKPHDWVGLSFPELTNAVYTYTRDIMLDLAAQDTVPEYVSLGNEINGGMLFPDGRNDSSAGWDNLGHLLEQGYRAVKSVSPSTRVIVHIGTVNAGTVNWFFGNLEQRNVPYDVIGCSYYPYWTDLSTEQARDQINQWAPNFGKPVLIMETGYNWNLTTCDGYPGQLKDNLPETYPSTPQGQKDFLLKCFKDLKLVNDGVCFGDVYWDPVFICVPGQGWKNGARNVVANTALFDFSGDVLPAMDAFEFND